MLKRFSDQEIIQNQHFADLGEVGDFYADTIAANETDVCFNKVKAFGILFKGEEKKQMVLTITFPQEIDVLSLPAGKLFQSGWEEWQIETL